MAGVHGPQLSDEGRRLLDPAWQLRWRAPEMALLFSDRAIERAAGTGEQALRLRAESLALFALNRLGRGVTSTQRALSAIRDAEEVGADEIAADLRVELACAARQAGGHDVAVRVLHPVLRREQLEAAARVHALVEFVCSAPDGAERAAALDEAERLCGTTELDRDTARILRARISAARAGHSRREGEFDAAAEVAGSGLALLGQLGDPGADSGEFRASLALERVHALLELGQRSDALHTAEPVLHEPVRAASAGPVGWLRFALATRVHLLDGAAGTAVGLLGEAARSAEWFHLDDLLAESLSTLSHVHEENADTQQALQCLRRAYAADRRWRAAVHSARLRLHEEFPASADRAAAPAQREGGRRRAAEPPAASRRSRAAEPPAAASPAASAVPAEGTAEAGAAAADAGAAAPAGPAAAAPPEEARAAGAASAGAASAGAVPGGTGTAAGPAGAGERRVPRTSSEDAVAAVEAMAREQAAVRQQRSRGRHGHEDASPEAAADPGEPAAREEPVRGRRARHGRAATSEPAAGQAAADEHAPSRAAPSQAAPDHTASGRRAPDRATPDRATPGWADADRAAAGQSAASRAAGSATSEQAASESAPPAGSAPGAPTFGAAPSEAAGPPGSDPSSRDERSRRWSASEDSGWASSSRGESSGEHGTGAAARSESAEPARFDGQDTNVRDAARRLMDALTGRTGQDGHEDLGATAARASDVPEPRVPTSERSRSEPASSWRRAEERSATGSPGEPTFSESYSGDPRSGGEDAGIAAATEFPTGPKTFDDDPADRGEPATSAQPGLSAGLPGGPGSPERGSSEEASSPGEPSFAGEPGFSGEPGLSEWASGSEGARFAGDPGPAEESGLSGGRRSSEQWSLSSDSGRAEDAWLWERSFDAPGGSADRGAEELTGPAPTLPSLSDSSSSLPTGVVDSGLTDTGASGPPGTPLSTADSTSAADERPDRDPLLGSGSSWMEAAERSGDDEEPGDADLDRLGDWDVDSWDVASFGRGTAGYGGSRYDGSHSDGSPQDGYDSYESSRHEGAQHEGAQHEGAQHGGPRYDSPQYDSPQYDSSWYDSYDLDGFGGAGRDDLSGDAVLREPEQLDRDPLGERDGSDRAAPDSAADHDEQARARSGKTLAEIRESLRLLQERSGTAAAARESAAQPAAQFVDPDDPLGDQGDPIGGGGRRRRHSDSEDVAAASAEPEPGEPASDLLGRYGVTEPERVQPREPDPEPVVEQPAEPSEDAGLADLLAEALVAYESGRQDPSHEQSRTDAPPSGGTPGGRRHVETDSSGAGVPASRHLQQSTSDSSVPRRHRRASADPASAQASWTPSAEAHARRHF